VTEFFGSVSVEAQVENVQHFEVRTALLAAVVKGTTFTVVADKTRASVSVQRGHVAVTDAKGKNRMSPSRSVSLRPSIASRAGLSPWPASESCPKS
jgi:ferric-dicitrate binding protein FerR (iron transport regulator)